MAGKGPAPFSAICAICDDFCTGGWLDPDIGPVCMKCATHARRAEKLLAEACKILTMRPPEIGETFWE